MITFIGGLALRFSLFPPLRLEGSGQRSAQGMSVGMPPPGCSPRRAAHGPWQAPVLPMNFRSVQQLKTSGPTELMMKQGNSPPSQVTGPIKYMPSSSSKPAKAG